MVENERNMITGRGLEKYADAFGFPSSEDLRSELEGKQILDAGSGEGNLKKELGEEFNVKNLDVRHIPDSKSVQGMGEFMPFKDKSFDTILCNHSLFFYAQETEEMTLEESLTKQAKETYRVLKDGGKMYIVLFPVDSEYESPVKEDSKFYTYTTFKRNELIKSQPLMILKNVGFNIDKVEKFKTVTKDGDVLVLTRTVLSKGKLNNS
jgi:ubiquinone/menaquinone biosynthesis C-methylase UbiE